MRALWKWLLPLGASVVLLPSCGARSLVNVDVVGDAPFTKATLILADGIIASKTFSQVTFDAIDAFPAGLYLPSSISGAVTITATVEDGQCVIGQGSAIIPGVAAGTSSATVDLFVAHVVCQPIPGVGGHAGGGGMNGGGGGPGSGGMNGAAGNGSGDGGMVGGGAGSGGSSGLGGVPGTGTGGSGVGGAVMGTGGATATVSCGTDPALIDDMESGTGDICQSNGRGGYWFSYVDASSTLSPSTVPTPPTVLPTPRGASLRAVHISGTLAAGGSTHYAGVGCFMDTVPTTYNAPAHGYSGIQFYVMGTASAPTLIVQNTDTESTEYYGTCTAPVLTNCIGNFAPISGLSPNQWISVSVPFTAISGGSAAFLATDIWSIEFQPGPGAYDLWIDDLSFY